MKVLLDECISRKLKDALSSVEPSTIAEQGWAGKKNGELLSLAEKSGFKVFLTLDRGFEYQQNLHPRNISVVLIRTKSNRLADLMPKVPAIAKALESLKPAQVVKIE